MNTQRKCFAKTDGKNSVILTELLANGMTQRLSGARIANIATLLQTVFQANKIMRVESMVLMLHRIGSVLTEKGRSKNEKRKSERNEMESGTSESWSALFTQIAVQVSECSV